MTPETQRLQAEAIEANAGRTMTPEPGGLIGRIARAHDEAAAALAAGDIDGEVGASMLAKALTDAALCEPEAAEG